MSLATLTLAARLGIPAPTTAILASPDHLQQWSDRVALAESIASRGGDLAAARAECARHDGRPIAPRAWPAPAVTAAG